MRIDAHQHFWQFDPIRDNWITEKMAVIRRDFMPLDLKFLLQRNAIDGCIAVQADQSEDETAFLVDLAKKNPFIKAVVGWVDLRSADLQERLQHFKKEPLIKGFRHIVEAEEDPDFLIQPDFLRGIQLLTQFGYTYDLLIKPIHYAATLACVAQHPQQVFILDHIAKPAIKAKEFAEWASFIENLAQFDNVHCKVSGLATEADWGSWQAADFIPYIEHVIQYFGKDRIMFGSDWPVCLLAASYEECIAIVENKLQDFSPDEQEASCGSTN